MGKLLEFSLNCWKSIYIVHVYSCTYLQIIHVSTCTWKFLPFDTVCTLFTMFFYIDFVSDLADIYNFSLYVSNCEYLRIWYVIYHFWLAYCHNYIHIIIFIVAKITIIQKVQISTGPLSSLNMLNSQTGRR